MIPETKFIRQIHNLQVQGFKESNLHFTSSEIKMVQRDKFFIRCQRSDVRALAVGLLLLLLLRLTVRYPNQLPPLRRGGLRLARPQLTRTHASCSCCYRHPPLSSLSTPPRLCHSVGPTAVPIDRPTSLFPCSPSPSPGLSSLALPLRPNNEALRQTRNRDRWSSLIAGSSQRRRT